MKSIAKKEIGQLIRSYRRQGFIFPRESSGLGNNLCVLLQTQKDMQASDLHWWAWESIEQGIASYEKGHDDSSGYFGTALRFALEILEALATGDALDKSERKKLFDKCLRFWLSGVPSGYGIELDNLVVVLADTANHQRTVFDVVGLKLEKLQQETEYWDFELETLLLVKYRMIERLDSPQAASAFLYQHLDKEGCREEALKIAFEAKDYEEMKKLAVSGIELDTQRGSGFVTVWEDWLAKWAEATGDTQLEFHLLEKDFLRRPSMEKYQRLKAKLSPETFAFKLEAWFDKLQKHASQGSIAADIAIFEERWDQLWMYLVDSHEFYGLRDYAEYLPASYKEEVIALYASKWEVFIDGQAGRPRYQVAARQLKQMIKLGGLDQAKRLVEEAYHRHPGRPAMKEEFEAVMKKWT